MNRDFFVMLYHPNGSYLPLTGDDDEMQFFNTVKEADRAAESSMLGSAYGWETFQMGAGE